MPKPSQNRQGNLTSALACAVVPNPPIVTSVAPADPVAFADEASVLVPSSSISSSSIARAANL
eukprot:10493618-Lingulodinium_polyedra.AAC.1